MEIGKSSIGFESLPMEILIKIYRHLDFYDIEAASQTCRQWFSAAGFEEFNQNIRLKFSNILLSDLLVPADIFFDKSRDFRNLYFEAIIIEDCRIFLTSLGQSIKSITFDTVKLDCNEFCTIIESIKDLKEIKIIKNSKILSDSTFLIDPENVASISNSMAGVTSLSLVLTSPEIKSFERLVSLTTALEKLELDFAFSYQLNDTTNIANILKKIIANNVNSLKELSLKHVIDTGDFLTSITTFNGFYLNKFRSIDITPWRSLLIFITTQNHLVELDLSDSKQMTDGNVRLLVKFLLKLRVFKLKSCTKITDLSLNAIFEKLKLLESLDISYCERITCYGIKETFANNINMKFKELHLAGLELHASSVIKICKNLPNLELFDIGHCMGVSNCLIQRIIIDLVGLRKLNLEGCKLISDFALTGLNVETGDDEGFSIKRLTRLQYLNLKGCKQITDISFLKNTILLELKELCLPNIAICASDIKMLAANCPSLVKLDLSECETMENVDKVMESFKNFKRLKEFQFAKFHINYVNKRN